MCILKEESDSTDEVINSLKKAQSSLQDLVKDKDVVIENQMDVIKSLKNNIEKDDHCNWDDNKDNNDGRYTDILLIRKELEKSVNDGNKCERELTEVCL